MNFIAFNLREEIDNIYITINDYINAREVFDECSLSPDSDNFVYLHA